MLNNRIRHCQVHQQFIETLKNTCKSHYLFLFVDTVAGSDTEVSFFATTFGFSFVATSVQPIEKQIKYMRVGAFNRGKMKLNKHKENTQ